MNRNMIMGAAAGLLLGVGGGTGFVVVTKPDAPPATAHVAADSLAADTSAHAPAGDSAHAPVDSSAAHTAVAAATHANDGPAQSAPPARPESGPGAATPSQPRTAPAADSASVRLGRIFGAMKPEDAAAVLSRLDDAEVKSVLFQLSDRKAAEILARFPGDRAANLTKTLLTDARTH